MAAREGNAALYAEQMEWNGIGKALLDPVSTRYMKLGSCGVLDERGNWRRLMELSDADRLQKDGFTVVRGLEEPEEDNKRSWGPLHSESVRMIEIGGSAGADIPNAPAEAGVKFAFSTQKNFGAVLITQPYIHRQHWAWDDPFDKWVQENTGTLMTGQRAKEIQKFGLLIITGIYTTTSARIATWNDRKQQVFFGFSLKLTGAGSIDQNASWLEGSAANGWKASDAMDNERVIVAIKGKLYTFKKGIWSKEWKVKEEVFRSSSDNDNVEFTVPISDSESYQVNGANFGHFKREESDLNEEEGDDEDEDGNY